MKIAKLSGGDVLIVTFDSGETHCLGSGGYLGTSPNSAGSVGCDEVIYDNTVTHYERKVIGAPGSWEDVLVKLEDGKWYYESDENPELYPALIPNATSNEYEFALVLA